MKGAVLNKMYHVSHTRDASQPPLVVRVVGPIAELYDVDRKQEVKIMRMLKGSNLVPNLEASFENGLVCEFIPGDNMTKSDFEDKRLFRCVSQSNQTEFSIENPEDSSLEILLEMIMTSTYFLV